MVLDALIKMDIDWETHTQRLGREMGRNLCGNISSHAYTAIYRAPVLEYDLAAT